MSNKDNVEVVGDENIREMMGMDGITETLEDGTKDDNDAGECVMPTALSINNKEEDGDDRDVMDKLGK